MAPSVKAIEAKLRKAVEEVYHSDPEQLTVRFIRDKVEHELKLDEGFFATPNWKDRSKTLIKDWAAKLINEAEADEVSDEVKSEPDKKPPPAKKVTKRASKFDKPPPRKRQKKEETPSEDEISELSAEESPASDLDDSDASEAPKPKTKAKSKPRAPVKRESKKRAKVESDESGDDDVSKPQFDSDEDSDVKPAPKKVKKEAHSRRQSKKPKIESDEESEEEYKSIKKSPVQAKAEASIKSDEESEEEVKNIKKSPIKAETKPSVTPEDADEKADIKAQDSDSSEMSIVLDEEPKRKRRSKSKSEASSSKSSKAKAAPKQSKDLSPDEVQIKTLQTQLTKCGVRKIWGIELKKFGDDSKKKIKHLQSMLRDVGMTGRFSEQRAREIKELRELQADLEAVKEGESKWGLESGRRARGQRKSLKESPVDDEDEDVDVDEESEGRNTKSRTTMSGKPSNKAARAKQDLAFLGDEESDSD